MKKSWKQGSVTALVVCSLMLASIGSIQADQPIPVIIDGKVQTFDQPPVFVNDRMLVPMRAIFEALGADVKWSPDAPSLVIATKGDITITLTIGSKTAYKNGTPVTLDVPPQVIHNRTVVPIRFVSESLGADVKWDSVSRTVQVHTTPSTPQNPGTDLTVEQVGEESKSVALINILNETGKVIASGSGFVVSSDGKIITNYHVIEGASNIQVVFPDKSTYTTTTVLRADKEQDLAELKINANGLTALTLGDSDGLHLGQSIVAIGSPQGLQNTLSTGVVSSTARDDGKGHSYIQISAPIDHGSSGGALFDMHGDVVGVTSYGYNSTASLNLAIPSNTVKTFLLGTETAKSLSELFPKLSLDAMKALLNQQFGTLTYKGHTFHLEFADKLASNGVSVDLTAYLSDPDEYKDMMTLQQNDPQAIQTMMAQMMDVIRANGQYDPMFVLYTAIKVQEKTPGVPDAEYVPLQEGGYGWSHAIAAAIIDPDTNDTYIKLDPFAQQ